MAPGRGFASFAHLARFSATYAALQTDLQKQVDKAVHLLLALREAPDDPQLHLLRGLALAYAGRFTEAVSEGERGVTLVPISKDAEAGAYYVHLLVRIHLLAGHHDKAMDQLERLFATPYYVSKGWLRIDPEFKPLHGNPRFERLARGAG